MVRNNVISSTEKFGVYVLKSRNICIQSNRITQFTRGIHVDVGSSDIRISDNSLFSVFPKLSEHAIALEEGANDCKVEGNHISGIYKSAPIKDIGENNMAGNNNCNIFHSHLDEVVNINRYTK